MLKLLDVRVSYGKREVVHGISLSLPAGENLAIVGPNGCGKTTLLKAIAGLIPYAGSITHAGTEARAMPRREAAKKVALLGQMPAMQAGYSVRETVTLGRYAHSRPGLLGGISEADAHIVDEALAVVGLGDIAHRDISTLSGGQLQRVFVAKTLVQDPDVILLDEPTNHLDLCYQIELVSYLKAWSEVRRRSVVGVLHDLNLAMLLSQNVLLMREGEAVAFGDMDRVLSVKRLKHVYGLDVAAFMRESLARWNHIPDETEV